MFKRKYLFIIIVLLATGHCPLATVFGQATQLVITTGGFSITLGNPSPTIIIEAQDGGGAIDPSFNETVLLETSSASGVFSASRASWQDTNAITLVNGRKFLYYRDAQDCVAEGVAITVSRAGLASFVQAETISPPSVSAASSYMFIPNPSVPGDGISGCNIIVNVNDAYGFPVPGRQVTLWTDRGSPVDVIIQPVSLTDAGGQCTGAIKSGSPGGAFIAAVCDDNTITRGIDLEGARGVWFFDRDAKDHSGSGNDGFDSGAVWVSDAQMGGGVRLDGISSCVLCDPCSAADTQFSIELWTKPKNYPPSNSALMAGKLETLYIGLQDGGDGGWGFVSLLGGEYYAWYNDANPITLDTWNHFVVSFRDGKLDLYLNGALSSQGWGDPAGALGDSGYKMRMGNEYPASDNIGGAYDGIIDEAKIYDRFLSETDVAVLYNRQARINFTLTSKSLKFTTPVFSVTKGNPSFAITIEAQDESLQRIPSFNETVSLSASSPGAAFSVSSTQWADTDVITLSSGSATVYYKDDSAGYPFLTVSRDGFIPDAQQEIIEEPVVSETLSYLTIYPYWVRATGKDPVSVEVFLKDQFGFPLPSKDVTLSTLRAETDSLSSNPQASGADGKCAWTVTSSSYGTDTASAVSDGVNIQNLMFFDPFSEADTVPHNWQVSGGIWSIAGGAMNGAGNGGMVFLPENGWSDYAYSSKINSTDAGFRFAMLFRAQDADNMYKYTVEGGGHLVLYRVTGGANNLLADAWIGFNAGQWYEFKVRTEGSTITCYLDDVTQFSLSDPAYASGSIGLRCGDNTLFDTITCFPAKKAFKYIPAAQKVRFINEPKTAGRGVSSDSFPVEALYSYDSGEYRDTWCYDTITLQSSSPTGRFSLDKAQWSASNESPVTFVKGYAKFYYRDTSYGTHTLTAYGSWLMADTQTVTVGEAQAWETGSAVTARQPYAMADGVSQCSFSVYVRNMGNDPIEFKQVTLYSTRGNSDVFTQPGVTDANGMCTGYAASIYPGDDTVSAVCDGVTITQNLVINPSFEGEGIEGPGYVRNWVLDYYHLKQYHHRVEGMAHSGRYSLVSTFNYTDDSPPYTHSMTADSFPILANSKYRISAWVYNSLTNGTARIDIWDKPGQPTPGSTLGGNKWEYVSGYWNDSLDYTQMPIRCVSDGNPLGQAWFDDMKCERVPMFSFVPTPKRVVITSQNFTVTPNNPVPMTVEVRDDFGNVAPLFDDTVALASSSNSAGFSISNTAWSSVNYITLKAGRGSMFYKDAVTGNPVITVTRYSLLGDTQTENVIPAVLDAQKSSLFSLTPVVRADGTETAYVVVTIKDTLGYPMQNRSVTLAASRGSTLTLVTSANPLITDLNGQCTFTAVSANVGFESFSASSGGSVMSYMLYDDFSSYALGSNCYPAWSPDASAWQVADTDGNRVFSQIDSGTEHIAYAGNAAWKDYTFEVRAKTTATKGPDSWLVGCFVFRSPRPGTYYYFLMHTANYIELGQDDDVSGHHPSLASVPSNGKSPFDWHDYKVIVSGTKPVVIRIYVDGDLMVNYSDDSYCARVASGGIGLRCMGASAMYDNVRVYPCGVSFAPVASKLKIASDPFSSGIGLPSPVISVEAQDAAGNRSSIFNDVVDLSSSSDSGSFSLVSSPWSDTNALALTEGAGTIYYKDLKGGSPTLTVSCGGLQPDTQTESISTAYIWETNSFLTVSNGFVTSNGTEKATVTVTVKNLTHSPIPGKEITVRTSRGDSDPVDPASSVTDENGQCTFTISSGYSGDAYVYAYCDGSTITENVIANPSFEGGAGTNAQNWLEAPNHSRSSDRAYSGGYSLKVSTVAGGSASFADRVNVHQNSAYKMSAWFYRDPAYTGTTYVDMQDIAGELTLFGSGSGSWQYVEGSWQSLLNSTVQVRCVTDGDPTGNAWFDEVRLFRTPTITFVGLPVKLKIVTSPATMSKNNPMILIVEAQDTISRKVMTFKDSITLFSTSVSGTFSLSSDPWSGTNTIYLSSGEAAFYFKDSAANNPVIFVSAPGLDSDSQMETIVDAVFSANCSRIFAFPGAAKANMADTIAAVANVSDIYGFPISGMPVTLHSSDTRVNIAVNPVISNSQGACTFSISSGYTGASSLSAVAGGETVSYMLYDDFSAYADGTDASPNWQKTGGTWTVTNHELNQSVGAGHAWSGNVLWKDYTFEASMKTTVPGAATWDAGRLTFRYSDSDNFYFILLHALPSRNLEYGVSRTSGWYSNLKVVPTDLIATAWHDFKIVVSGSGPVNIEVFVDGQSRFTQVESEDTYVLKSGAISLWGAGNQTAFDNIRVYPCIIRFTADRSGIVSDPFRLKAGMSSGAVSVAASGALGGVDTSYNTDVVLSTSSVSGAFSISPTGPWSSPKNISIINGLAGFYYKDYKIGYPLITVTPVSPGFLPGAQTETITACAVTLPYFGIRTSETSSLITAVARGYDGETDANFNETATVLTSSPAGRFSISATAWQETTAFRFNSGFLGFYYRDRRGGSPSVSISNAGLGISASRAVDVVLPGIQVTLQEMNLRTGISGTTVEIASKDTIEYSISVYNSGNETASGVIVTDLEVFDSSAQSAVDFISIDTSSADSWSYTLDAASWETWGLAPAYGLSIKGLSWLVNTLGINAAKVLKFRVRIR